MAQNWRAELNRTILLAVVGFAALGWLFVILDFATGREADLEEQLSILQSDRDQLQARLVEQQQAAGTLERLRHEVQSSRNELAALTAQQDAKQRQLASTGSELNGLEVTVQQRRQELKQAGRELDRVRSEIAPQMEELAEITDRLERARRDESNILQTIAELSDKEAALSQQAAQAQTRIHETRDTVSAVQNDIANTRSQLTQLREEVGTLTEEKRSLQGTVLQVSAEGGRTAQAAQDTRQEHAVSGEDGFWLAAERSGDPKLFKHYLELYPNGAHVQEARAAVAAVPESTQPEAVAGAQVQCDIDACSRAYRSFRASDCSYRPYTGRRTLCPHLGPQMLWARQILAGTERKITELPPAQMPAIPRPKPVASHANR